VIEQVVKVTEVVLTGIGGATILFRLVAPYTETKMDNKAVRFLDGLLRLVSVNKDEKRIVVEKKQE